MKKFEETVIKNGGAFFAVHKDGKTTYEIQGLTSSPLIIFEDWVSLEDHQQVAKALVNTTDKLDCAEERVGLLEKTVDQLKSQLEKQQPEIPRFVAKFIKYTADPIYEISAWAEHYGDNGSKCDDPDLAKTLDWFGMNRNLFYKAVINGYTVAKEKRFYLKNKLTGQRLIRLLEENGGGFLECVTSTDKERMQFTQSQIDSMETGSYEQIEVEE